MSAYLWIKALHIIAVISWMAGMLYLPRLFVYHAGQESSSSTSALLKVMEYRLLRYIMTPAMIVVWLTGLHLVISAELWRDQWFWFKFLCVLCLSAIHFVLAAHSKAFAEDQNCRSHKYFRFLNEVPTLLMIFIVILVVVRPF